MLEDLESNGGKAGSHSYLALIRKQRGMTQKDLGDIIGLSARVVSNIESGTRVLRPEEIGRLTGSGIVLSERKQGVKELVTFRSVRQELYNLIRDISEQE